MAAKRAGEGDENPTQFCVIPRKSIKLLAESVGIQFLSSEGAGLLAEDISYRIRQTVQSALEFAKHSKRDHLTGEDINRALYWSRVEPIYGYGSKNSNIFSSISTKDGEIFYHEDKEVNLRELTFSKGLSSLNELGDCHSKINIETLLLNKTKSNSTDGQSNGSVAMNFDALSVTYKLYYNQVTRHILNSDEDILKAVLADLKINPKIQIFLPYLVNFISTGIKLLTGNFNKVLRLLSLVKTLVDNKNLYLEPWVLQIVRAVMYCVVEKPVTHTGNGTFDSWMIRNKAIQILCHIDRKCSNTANYLHHQLLRTFKDIYEDKERPLYSHYGAIVGIYMLGVDAVAQTILPHFKTYVGYLQSLHHTDLSENIELNYIMHALKTSVLSLFRSKLRFLADFAAKETETEHSKTQNYSNGSEVVHKSNYLEHGKWNKDIVTWYNDSYELFGEVFVLQSGNVEDFEKTVVHSIPSTPVSTFSVHKLHSQMSNLPYIRNLIKNAVSLTVKTNSGDISSFSLPAKKRRLGKSVKLPKKYDEGMISLASKLKFLNDHDSEIRFDSLVKKASMHRNRNKNWKCYVRKEKRYPRQSYWSKKPKFLFSLSFL